MNYKYCPISLSIEGLLGKLSAKKHRNGGYFQHANVAKYEFSIICVCKDLSGSNFLKTNQYSDFCRYILRLIVVLNIDFLSSQRCEAGLHLGISRANLLNHSTLKY